MPRCYAFNPCICIVSTYVVQWHVALVGSDVEQQPQPMSMAV